MDIDFHYGQVKFEDNGHLTYIAHLRAIFVFLFATLISATLEIFVSETSYLYTSGSMYCVHTNMLAYISNVHYLVAIFDLFFHVYSDNS